MFDKSVEDDRIHGGVDGVPGVSGGVMVSSNLALCTMFKNEAAYLEEWLEYHQLIGVTKVKRVSWAKKYSRHADLW